jgi:outer membrane protein, heavy metal efflux system
MKFILTLVALGAVLSTSPFTAQAQTADELAHAAIAANPGIRSVQQQVTALVHQVDSSSLLSDPVVSIEYSNFPVDSWSLGDSPMTGIQVKLQQTIPLPGKNSRREAVALSALNARKLQLEENKVQLGSLVRQAYWQLALVRQLRTITEKHISLLDELIKSVRSRYAVGVSGQQHLLRLQLMQEKLRDDLSDFSRDDIRFSALINSTLHRSSSNQIITPEEIEPIAPYQTEEALIESARRNRPQLKYWQMLATNRRVSSDLARFEKFPDLTFWVAYRYREEAGPDDGTDQMSLGVAVPLPLDLYGKSAAASQSLMAMSRSADSSAIEELDRIKAQVQDALATWNRAVEKIANYRDKLLPGAERVYQSAMTALRSGRADFTVIYDAQLQILLFEKELRVAIVRAQLANVKTMALVGSGL